METCFAFGREHGLLDEEQMKMIQEGTEQIRAALKETPPEVLECLKATVGENIIQDINAGTMIPGPEVGLRMRSCFEAQGVAAENKMQECAALSCDQFFACLESIGGGERDGEEGNIPLDLQQKINSCRAEIEQRERQNAQPQGENGSVPQQPSEGEPQQYQGPSEEQIRQQYEQQYQQQYEQQYQQQQPQPPPSSETP